MKKSSFKGSNGEKTVEANGTAANIIAWGFFIALVIPAAGLTYVVTKDTNATLDVIKLLKPKSRTFT